MKRNRPYLKLVLATMLAMATQFAVGSFIGSTTSNERKERYTLKSLNKNLVRGYSLSSFRASNYQFTGSQILGSQRSSGGQVEVNSLMRLEHGNTSYIFPYKYKVKAPKFVTPSR